MLKINHVKKKTLKLKNILTSTNMMKETHLNLEQKYITYNCY
jgi:hypothetical protein